MRIGIITHWWCFENYGQLLQGYALQKYLAQHGHSGFIIRYFMEAAFSDKVTLGRILMGMRSWKSFKKGLSACIKRIRKWLDNREKRIRALRDFDGFRAENLKYTEKIYRSYADLGESDEISADMYLVGSDVVWKMLQCNNDGRVMFLDFETKGGRKIAYSASFGDASVSQEFIDFAGPLVCNLDAVSVREPTGVDICNRMGRRDAVCVMDPVFLLGAEFYRREFKIPNERSGVYGYFLEMDPPIPVQEMLDIARVLKQGVPQFVTVYDDGGLPEELLSNPTLPEWICMIGSAKLFVTNSFHGASMAIILHTPFVVLLKYNGTGMDNRLLGLLGRLNLLDRISDGDVNSVATVASRPIDWEQVEVELRAGLRVSLNFLEECGI